MSDHLYFIASGDCGPVKVGRAKDIKRRLCDLQSGSADELAVIAVIDNGGAWEHQVHAALADDRVRGEWFARDAVIGFLDLLVEARIDRLGAAA